MVGPSGLEPPTSCLSGTRSNLLSYEPLCLWSPALWVSTLPTTDGKQNDFPFPSAVGVSVGLSFRTVARPVFSPPQSLTCVFGMGTGGPSAFETLTSQGCRLQGFRTPLCAFPLPLRVPASLSRPVSLHRSLKIEQHRSFRPALPYDSLVAVFCLSLSELIPFRLSAKSPFSLERR